MAEECTRHAELVKRLEQNEKDIRRLEDKSNDVSIQFARQDTKLDYIKDAMKEMQETVKKLAEQPAKRWDALINAGITTAISLLVSSGIAVMLLKH